jgi:hypothetical protein
MSSIQYSKAHMNILMTDHKIGQKNIIFLRISTQYTFDSEVKLSRAEARMLCKQLMHFVGEEK